MHILIVVHRLELVEQIADGLFNLLYSLILINSITVDFL